MDDHIVKASCQRKYKEQQNMTKHEAFHEMSRRFNWLLFTPPFYFPQSQVHAAAHWLCVGVMLLAAPSSWKPNSSRILPLSDSIHNDLSRMRFSAQLNQFTSIQVWCSFPFYLQQVGTTSSFFNFICNILELKSLVSSTIWSRFSLLLVALRS